MTFLTVKPLAITALGVAVVIFAFIALLPRRFDSNGALVELRRAICCLVPGLLGYGLRDELPDFFAVYIANAGVLATHLFLGRGLRRFRGTPDPGWRLDLALLLLFLLAFIPHTFITPDWQARTVIIGTVFFVPLLRNALTLLRPPLPARDLRAVARLIAAFFLLDAVWRLGVVSPYLLLGHEPATVMTDSGLLVRLGLATSGFGILLGFLGLCWLVFARLADDLRTALDSREQLLALVAHDLRNPFAVILGNAEQVSRMRQPPPVDLFRQYGQTMLRSATRAYDLLENLLFWGHGRHLHYDPRPLELLPLVRHACAHAVAGAGAKNIDLVIAIPAGLSATADSNMLAAVIRNLAGNAVKFTPEGGRITVSATAADGGVEIAVRDTGAGCTPDTCAALATGQALRSTRGTAGEMGSGLGLQLVRDMLARHDSTLRCDCPPDGGSRFSFILP